MLNKFSDLKFYNGFTDFFKSVKVKIEYKNILEIKTDFFFDLCRAQVLKRLNLNFYGKHSLVFILTTPLTRGTYDFVDEDNLNPDLDAFLIKYILKYVCSFGLILPDVLCSLKQHYPLLNISFDHVEFLYLDFGVTCLPVIEELLIYLVQNFQPLNRCLDTHFFVTPTLVPFELSGEHTIVSGPDRNEHRIMIKPAKVIEVKIEDHMKEYYFNNNVTSKDFLEIISLYLEARSSLKNKCIIEGNKDKFNGKKVPENLAMYFVCNYLTKDLTEYMYGFMVANLDLNDKNPLYTLRDLFVKKGDTYPKEAQEKYLESYRRELKKNLESLDVTSIPKDIIDEINKALSKMS